MTIQTTKHTDDRRQMFITAEIGNERLETEMRVVARDAARRFRIPGFRPGKAPYKVVLSMVGEQSLRADAVEALAPRLISEILEAAEVEELHFPVQLHDVAFDPFAVTLLLALPPVVVLGDYRSERRAIPEISITPEAVDERLELLRNESAFTVNVERPARLEDSVTVSGSGVSVADPADVIMQEEGFEFVLKPGALFEDPSFVEHLVGATPGEVCTFEHTFPDPYESDAALAGKTVRFELTLEALKERRLPDLDDSFAESIGHASLAAARESIEADLRAQAEKQQRDDIWKQFTDSLVENVQELVYPPAAVQAQLDEQIGERRHYFERMGIPWERYLSIMGTTEAKLREEYEANAVEVLEARLVMRAFIEQEQIDLAREEILAALEAKRNAEAADEPSSGALSEELISRTGNRMLADRVLERVRAIYAGTAPDLTVTPAAAEVADEVAAVGETAASERQSSEN